MEDTRPTLQHTVHSHASVLVVNPLYRDGLRLIPPLLTLDVSTLSAVPSPVPSPVSSLTSISCTICLIVPDGTRLCLGLHEEQEVIRSGVCVNQQRCVYYTCVLRWLLLLIITTIFFSTIHMRGVQRTVRTICRCSGVHGDTPTL